MKCILVCVAVLYFTLPAHSWVVKCPLGQYLHLSLKECRNCSTCPKNQIIRKPCDAVEDTVCGPFSEFINFQQNPDENEYVDPESTHPDHHKHGKHHKGHHHNKKHPAKAPHPTSELHILPLDTTEPQGEGNSVMDLTSAVSSGEEQWKTLAMALIGILCVVSVSLVLFVMTVCYIRHKRQAVEKEIIYDPEMMECHQSTYVQVQPYVSSRDRLKSKSNIRALRELQQNAYDSGSDDSCGNPAPPSSRLLGQPVIGSVVVDDYDADNSGQTITTTKSSDYVYFNSPQNANGEP